MLGIYTASTEPRWRVEPSHHQWRQTCSTESLIRRGAYLLVLASLLPGSQIVRASRDDTRVIRAEHAVAAQVRRVDHSAKMVVLHTADGGHGTVAFSEHTVVHGVTSADSTVDAWAKDVLEGAWAIVLTPKTVRTRRPSPSILWAGRTVRDRTRERVRVDEAAGSMVITTKAGAEDTFELAGYVVVDAGRGVERGATPTCRAIETGAEVAISYSEQAGKKTAVVVKRM